MQRVSAHHASSNLVYYNASLSNPSDGKTTLAVINDTRSEPLIAKPEDWECSIIRFDISAKQLPPIVVPMVTNAVGLNQPSQLKITLRYLGVDYQQPLLFDVAFSDTVGFVFSIEDFMLRLNNASQLAYNALVAAAGAIPGVQLYPYFAFDPVTQLVSMYLEQWWLPPVGPADPVEQGWNASTAEIYVNSQLYNYIVSIPADSFGHGNPTGRDLRLNKTGPSAKLIPPTGFRIGYPILLNGGQQKLLNQLNPMIQISQAGPSVASMNGVRSIFITTTMPINSESLPTTTSVAQNSNYSSNSLPIMTDFLVSTEPETNPVVDRITVSYLPTAEYRMAQMRGNEPLTFINLKWFYTLQDGTQREMTLTPGGTASAKLMFRRAKASDSFSR